MNAYGAQLKWIHQLPQLQWLKLSSAISEQITTTTKRNTICNLHLLTQLPNLTGLEISTFEYVENRQLKRMHIIATQLRKLSSLTSLTLDFRICQEGIDILSSVTGTTIAAVGLVALKELVLRNSGKQAEWSSISFESLSSLSTLIFLDCRQATGTSSRSSGAHLPKKLPLPTTLIIRPGTRIGHKLRNAVANYKSSLTCLIIAEEEEKYHNTKYAIEIAEFSETNNRRLKGLTDVLSHLPILERLVFSLSKLTTPSSPFTSSSQVSKTKYATHLRETFSQLHDISDERSGENGNKKWKIMYE